MAMTSQDHTDSYLESNEVHGTGNLTDLEIGGGRHRKKRMGRLVRMFYYGKVFDLFLRCEHYGALYLIFL